MRFETFISNVNIIHANECDGDGIPDGCLYAMVYPGGSHIVRSDGDDGSWCLTIGNESELSDEILTLEAQLYLWAATEGQFDSHINNDTLFEWMVARSAQVKQDILDPTAYIVKYEDFHGYVKNEKHSSPRSALVAAWCKDTVREYLNQIDRSVYSVKGLA